MNTSTPDQPMTGLPTGAASTEYEDARRAGRHWPAAPPTEQDTDKPYQFGSPTLTRCPKCGGEYDTTTVTAETTGHRRCPRCARLHHPTELPSPATAADALERGRRAAGNY